MFLPNLESKRGWTSCGLSSNHTTQTYQKDPFSSYLLGVFREAVKIILQQDLGKFTTIKKSSFSHCSKIRRYLKERAELR